MQDSSSYAANLLSNDCGRTHPAENTVLRKELGPDVMQEAVRMSIDAHIPVGDIVRHLVVHHRIFIEKMAM